MITIEPIVSVTADIIPELTVIANTDNELQLMLNKPLDDIISIQWLPATGLDCYDCINPIANIDSETNYSIFVTDINGCTDETEIRLRIQRTIRYYIPNVFIIGNSSNEDDGFTIFSRDDDILEIESMGIYDRWGNKVFDKSNFQPNDLELGWDGYFNGRKALQGVYVYAAYLIFADGTEEWVSGDVTVLR